ncbi:MAG: SpoIID/LytB domain-containing protein [Pirellulales bacterium]|nr:SpoIID/LytB domain-containing protein [Pirellulales bacterium]
MLQSKQEPVIAVGLIDGSESVTIRLEGNYHMPSGRTVGPGEIHVACERGILRCSGVETLEVPVLDLVPDRPNDCLFSLEATIGIDFHWQQREVQSFRGRLQLVPQGENRIIVINHVPLETYIKSVICSEMNATAPPELAKAHAVISRSWLLAQLDTRQGAGIASETEVHVETEVRAEEGAGDSFRKKSANSIPCQIIRWTDREAHLLFDVCADDHCQRYQGIGRIHSPDVAASVAATRGMVLTSEGKACDARYSKCCGGVTEEFQTAWSHEAIPYLVAIRDAPNPPATLPPLTQEAAAREFILGSPTAYCNCTDRRILKRVLNDYDLDTHDFFRWQVRLDANQARSLIAKKVGIDLGRLVALEPVARGPSGRLVRLRLIGESGSLVIGKELEIRRALSEFHLYSSAFVVDTEGPASRPDTFVLSGAGWGHGVGLCQIGAAVMACQGIRFEEILNHYYPGTRIVSYYL